MNASVIAAVSALRGRRVLVTGAAGFFGAHLTPALLAAGAHVHAIVRTPHTAALPADVTVHVADLTEPAVVARAVADADPTCIFHLAAYGTTRTQPDADRMFQVNLEGTRHLWAAMGDRDCRLVQTGTCGEYGDVTGPIAESIACRPQSSYPASIHAAVTFSQARAFETGREVVIVRPFGPYGPADRPERLIPYVIRQLLSGTRAQVSDGWQLRDYSFIDDQVRALMLAATTPLPRVAPIYNIGSGAPIRVRDLLAIVARMVSGDAESGMAFGSRPSRADDPPEMFAQVTAARDELGYVAEIGLDEGLRRTVAWHRGGGDAR